MGRPEPVTSLSSVADGRYVVKDRLGEGGQKIVYLVQDQVLERECALAFLKPDGLDAESIAQFQMEAKTTARLGAHPNIVTIFDVGEEGGRPFIVTEYVSGGDLRQLVRQVNGPLAIEESIKIAKDVARALAFAHARGVIHRDIKPANIWITDDGTAKLGDFGIAVATDRSRLTLADAAGTVAYLAPERALGGEVDARSDLYSLGCVIYELVTGKPPFVHDNPMSVISQHVNVPPPPPSHRCPEVPAGLEQLILNLLAKSKAKRLPSAEAVLAELNGVRAGPGILVRPTTVGPLYRLSRTPFSGRERELATLKAALDSAVDGEGFALMLNGEAGIGKTRLTQELALYAQLRGVKVLIGHCQESESGSAYLPFLEVLSSIVDEEKTRDLRKFLGADAAIVAKLLPRLAKRLHGSPPAPQLAAESEHLLLFQAIAALLTGVASRTGVLLVLEDLHWADEQSLLLLKHVARRLQGSNLLIVGTYRDSDVGVGHPLMDVLADLRRERLSDRLRVNKLSLDDVRAMIAGVDHQEVPDGLVQSLYEQTEGNPFFVEEILKHLVEEGVVRWEGGALVVEDLKRNPLDVPEGVREVIGRRLARLSDPCRRLLTLASTMTGAFSWQVLKEVSEEEEDRLLDILDEALQAQVVREDRLGTSDIYQFSHALIRQTLYAELNGPRRVRTHLQVGTAIERFFASEVEPYLDELAHHFYEAASLCGPEKAIDYLVRAADRSKRLFANDEAIRQFDRARKLISNRSQADPRLGGILIELAELYELSGNYDDALRVYSEARQETGDTRAWSGEASTLRKRGEYEAALRLLDAAPKPVSPTHAAQLALERGWTLCVAGHYAEAIGVLETGLASGGSLPGRVVSQLHLQLARAELETGRIDDALTHALQAQALLEEKGDLTALVNALRIIGEAYERVDRLDEASAALREGVQIARRIGNAEEMAGCLVNLGVVALKHGDLDEAITDHQEASAEFERIGHASGRAICYGNLGYLYLRRGQLEEAIAHCQKALDFAQSIGHQPTIADVTRTLALVHMQRQQFREAAAKAEEAARCYAEMGSPSDVAECLELQTTARSKSGDTDDA